MPGLVRKLVVFAAVDGLILKPLHQRAQAQRSLKIDYKSHAVSSTTECASRDAASLEFHGIVGIRSLYAEGKHLINAFQGFSPFHQSPT